MTGLNEGTLLRMVGGFGDVLLTDGEEVRCRIRGKFKQEDNGLLVGDKVKVKVFNSTEGVIEDVLPRRNRIWRPSVANVDQMVAVISAMNPTPDWFLLNRQLVQAERCAVASIVCVNKVDLICDNTADELQKELELMPYSFLWTSAKTGEGMSVLKDSFKEKNSVLAGPSGVGKSTLLNTIQPGLELETSEVSEKIHRGKHTTRKVELFVLDSGGLVVDTPGFSKLKVLFASENINYEDLRLTEFFPEIKKLSVNCKFSSCFHENEPGCAVRGAVTEKNISSRRYHHYLKLLEEVRLEQIKRMR